MNLTEMRKEFATKVGVSQERAKELIATLEEVVVEGLLEDGKVVFGVLGSLEVSESAAREGRNPRTKETIQIPAKNKVKYKQSSKIKEIVNE